MGRKMEKLSIEGRAYVVSYGRGSGSPTPFIHEIRAVARPGRLIRKGGRLGRRLEQQLKLRLEQGEGNVIQLRSNPASQEEGSTNRRVHKKSHGVV